VSTEPHTKTENIYEIELVNNEKWKVNEEMMVHITAIVSDVESFTGDQPEDYIALGKKLDAHIDLLISNCNMTGQAHEELHKWLLPFIDINNELIEKKTSHSQSQTFTSIEKSLKEFKLYFK
jgi:hypothetical protein